MSAMLYRSVILALSFCVILAFASDHAVAAPPEVEKLIKQLSDPDETVRLKAAKELGKLKEKAKDAIPALTLATKDADEDVRSVAKKALAAVKEAVGDEDAEKINERLVPIIKELQAKDNKVRLAAIAKLEEMGAEAKPAGAALVEFGMLNINPKVQEAATAAFEKIDPVIHKEVLTILVDENLANRDRAVENLKSLGVRAKSAVPVIKLYHNNLSQGLAPGPGGKLVLRKVFTRTPPHTLKALVAIAPDDTDVQRIVLNLVGGSDDASRGGIERSEAILIMHSLKLENKQKYASLMAGLAASKGQRSLLIQELGKLGTDAKAALPVLQQLKTDKEAAVRAAANAAIEAIKE